MSYELKVGRNTYIITANDRFFDNGACVQLVSQSKEKYTWGRQATPILSKKSAKQLMAMDLVDCKSPYSSEVRFFGISEQQKEPDHYATVDAINASINNIDSIISDAKSDDPEFYQDLMGMFNVDKEVD